jgi:hypothetical protein
MVLVRADVRVDVTVASKKSVLDGFADLVGLGLPGTQTNTGHLGASVQGEHRPWKTWSAGAYLSPV